MGFFKNLVHSLNPRDQLKHPGQSIKNTVAAGLDPAGSIVRTGRGMQAMPTSVKTMYDPGGFTNQQPTPAAPNTYKPLPMMQLSPGAQQMYDDMMARSAARAAGGGYQAGTRMGAPAAAPAPVAPAAPAAQPLVGIAPPTRIPMAMADGGMVTGKQRAKLDVDCHYENKAFDRKPNGKPC
jgi:hypothetical protein